MKGATWQLLIYIKNLLTFLVLNVAVSVKNFGVGLGLENAI